MSQGRLSGSGRLWGDHRLSDPIDPDATTHLATDLTTGDEVELTTVASAGAAERLAALDSPYVAAVVATGEHDGTSYVVTERVRGTRLDRVLYERGALEPKVAVAVLAQVAAGLRDLHEAGLRHGGLTAADVVLGAAPGDDLTTTTPARLTGPVVDAPGVADDVLAAGRVLEAALSEPDTDAAGEAPDAGSAPGADASGTGPRSRADDRFSRGLSWVLARSTADDASKRHRDAAALRADLLTLLPLDERPADPPPADLALPVAAPATTPPDPTGPDPVATTSPAPAERRRLVPLAAAVVVALVLAGVAVAVVLGSDDAESPDTPTSARTAAPPSVPDDGRAHGDVDGDGLGDVVQVHTEPGSAPQLFTNLSRGDGLRVRSIRPAPDGAAPLLADLDGDGRVEALAVTGDGDGGLQLDAVGRPGSWTVSDTGLDLDGPLRDPSVVTVGDYDGDGSDDLAVRDGDTVRVALGGTEAMTAEVWAEGLDGTSADDTLVAVDLDADLRDDLVVVRRSDDTLLPLLSNGLAVTAGEPSDPVEDLAGSVIVGADLAGDGEGRVLVVPGTGGGSLRALAYDGSAWSQDDAGPLTGSPDEQVLSAGTTDLDGDGRDDLVVMRGPRLVFDVTLGDGERLGTVDAFVEMPYPDPATTATLVGGSRPLD